MKILLLLIAIVGLLVGGYKVYNWWKNRERVLWDRDKHNKKKLKRK